MRRKPLHLFLTFSELLNNHERVFVTCYRDTKVIAAHNYDNVESFLSDVQGKIAISLHVFIVSYCYSTVSLECETGTDKRKYVREI